MTNIKKAGLASIIILVLVIGICIASFAAHTGTILKEAKLRKTASDDSIVLEIIPKKEEVEVLAKEGDWYQVRYNKIKGYVSKDFIETVDIKDTTDTDKDIKTKEIKKGETFKLEKEVKVYIRPLINSKVIANLEKDKTIDIIGIRNNWAYVSMDSILGWVNLNSIGATVSKENENNQTENNDTPNQEPNNNQEENNQEGSLNKTAYISSTGINFREEPNTDSKVLKVFAQNAKITILEETGDWYKIKHNDQTGYVIKTYVSDKKVETTSRSSVSRTETKTVTTSVETENTVKEETKTSTSNKGQEVANYVKQFVGCRYVYGGSTPSGGFDCSGLTMYVYKKFGVSLSHSATAQSKVGTKVDRANLQPGDLVFFKNYRTNVGIGHVGIYIGNNKFVHASTEKTGVITSSLTGSYSTRFVTATRMF
ncbi:MAG: SH3 domain-containing protein [Clostridia bacterium]|nr:SH3 domain-containing protein [Clostridia bacterium]